MNSFRMFALLAALVQCCGAQPFEAQEIGKVQVGYGLSIGDIDGDGKRDVIVVDRRKVWWFRAPEWTRHSLSGRLSQFDHVCVAARDLNGDGRVEVAIGAQWNPGETRDPSKSGSLHRLSRTGDPLAPWTASAVPGHEPTVHRMRFVRVAEQEHRLVVLPLHGRGNRNGEGAGVRVLSYGLGPAGTGKAPELIDDRMHLTHNFDVVQWDDDVAEELLIGGREGVVLCDRARDGAWTRRAIVDGSFGGVGEVRLGRLGPRRRFLATVAPMHGTSVAVWLLSDAPEERPRRVVLASDLAQGHALACADVLGIGRDQVLVGWRSRNAAKQWGVRIYTPDESGASWTMSWLDRGGMACEDLRVADLDGDGDLDVIAAGRATRNVRIYWNRRKS